jgi:hydroxyacylglutathione hydrolase
MCGPLCVFAHAPILPDTLTGVVLASFTAGALAANCYVVGTASGVGADRREPADCVVIDPGMDAAPELERVLADHRLRPVLVLLTHGHFDHVASAAQIADQYGAACYIDPADRSWLTDPLAALTPDFRPLVTPYLAAAPATEPRRMAKTETGGDGVARLQAAGLRFDVIPTPGHTPGSTFYRTAYQDAAGSYDLVFTGDVLFEGTIGRTDLPGGDPAAMERTLASTVLSLADDVVVLPGHGRRTTIGRERITNPFLRQLA